MQSFHGDNFLSLSPPESRTFILVTSLPVEAIQYGGSKHMATACAEFGEILPEYIAPDHTRNSSR